MASKKMMQAYVNANREAVAESEDPHALITVLFDELIRSMRLYLSKSNPSEHNENEHFVRALTILYGLQSSLDFENGGEIADNLYRLYEYARQQLLLTSNGENSSGVSAAIDAMENIREAWHKIESGAIGGSSEEGEMS
jgi:flagellar protein FliS